MKNEPLSTRSCTVVPAAIDGQPRFLSGIPTRIPLEAAGCDLVEAIEREQRRIGHDLHDGICQELAAVHYALEAAKKTAGPSSKLGEQLDIISQGVHRAIHHTRLISRGLAPFELEDGDLAGALRELAGNTGRLHGIECRLQTRGPIPDFEPGAATHLFRIAQEAMQNGIRHGNATSIEMVLHFTRGEGLLAVTDNGNGLPPSRNPTRGMGWKIMRHRADLIGATVEMAAGPGGRGVRVRCRFPNNPGGE
jgi:signal transduction histidine kinase